MMFDNFPKIILSSQSPRRKDLLARAGLQYEVLEISIAEDYPHTLPLQEIPVFIARKKMQATRNYIIQRYPEKINHIILVADTLVMLHDQVLGKPSNKDAAKKMLLGLSNQTHQVITGVSITYGDRVSEFSEVTEVTFGELNSQQVEYYIDLFKPFDKSGSYGIQEWIGLVGIKKINGDINNVIGLPVYSVMVELQKIIN
ncbi:MAG: Maf family nucleotide pyrophosphatase [Phycisphaerales bacterium]|nr:Maf family nucleotide pyrophosphatase [Phycisphaerales bacterium]